MREKAWTRAFIIGKTPDEAAAEANIYYSNSRSDEQTMMPRFSILFAIVAVLITPSPVLALRHAPRQHCGVRDCARRERARLGHSRLLAFRLRKYAGINAALSVPLR
jgi:hypothetical protein